MSETLDTLLSRFPGDGLLQAIVLRPARDCAAVSVTQARALAGRGLEGDRSAARAAGGSSKRQVTLFQHEHLALLAAWLRREHVDPLLLRRNLVVSGLNLVSAKSPLRDLNLRLHVGASAVLEVTGPCDPCSKMERTLGAGAYTALRGHGGLTARVLVDGEIRLGDRVWIERTTQ
jgi:MOSC domain-containing protein YiiM